MSDLRLYQRELRTLFRVVCDCGHEELSILRYYTSSGSESTTIISSSTKLRPESLSKIHLFIRPSHKTIGSMEERAQSEPWPRNAFNFRDILNLVAL
ncbi:7541_t:CDS:2 [Funneliformis caledonium]|uniref:7541_t:CDS:1 n=1 Tax=Funneliformis caledonium TaxID=1117310 RepID=A0A9N8ZI15_9GLOM|nr:7541_t:CDS:2 [Funneliformis caledonium]